MMNATGILNFHGEGKKSVPQMKETSIFRKFFYGIKPQRMKTVTCAHDLHAFASCFSCNHRQLHVL